MADHIEISDAPGTWVVRAGGAVIAESAQALELREGDYDPVIYIPRGDIAMAFLEPSEKTTHCPHKGDATYFGVQTKSRLLADAAWSYEAPNAAVARIAGHLAFDTAEVTVEEV